MLSHLYLTNQLIVDTTNTRMSRSVVMLTVSVKLVERKENSHVGKVIVTKVTNASSKVGIMVSKDRTRLPEPVKAAGGSMPTRSDVDVAIPGPELAGVEHQQGSGKWRSISRVVVGRAQDPQSDTSPPGAFLKNTFQVQCSCCRGRGPGLDRVTTNQHRTSGTRGVAVAVTDQRKGVANSANDSQCSRP